MHDLLSSAQLESTDFEEVDSPRIASHEKPPRG
jgi:hypothetical protein